MTDWPPRTRASLTTLMSLVKRETSRPGSSRAWRAKSTSINLANIAACKSRSTLSAIDCESTACAQSATARTPVEASTAIGAQSTTVASPSVMPSVVYLRISA